MLRNCVLAGLLLAATAATASTSGHAVPERVESFATDSCSIETLGRAAAADTTKLQRVTKESAPGRSAEGGETTVYLENKQPKVVVVVYYGETGKTVARYYLSAATDYLVEQEVIGYRQPLSSKSQPAVAFRVPSVTYVCGATVKSPVSERELSDLQSDLKTVLSDLK